LELDLDSRCSFDRLHNLEVFNFGLIHADFGGLLSPVEDLHQKFLCFAAKVEMVYGYQITISMTVTDTDTILSNSVSYS